MLKEAFSKYSDIFLENLSRNGFGFFLTPFSTETMGNVKSAPNLFTETGAQWIQQEVVVHLGSPEKVLPSMRLLV